ncbi:MAG TPA: hypothetical protein VET90_02335 [Candidatus Binatus sp.]|nr:hypothetical protein [Candidatus Binatus sp.]
MSLASLVHPNFEVIPRPALNRWGKAAVVALVLLGLGALAGGVALVARPDGLIMQFDVAILDGSPFADFTIPGLILGGLFGVGSLATAILGLYRSRLAPFVAFAIGVGQMIWIVIQIAIIKELSFLHPTMFVIGLVIATASVPWGWTTFQGWRRS